jgi:thiopeptide-type bacteriocin biosynthesis protein
MELKRTFFIGDEWLYYKIYCGPMSVDRTLTEAIKPITDKLLIQGIIDKWYFVRYADPQNHIRIRFHLSKGARLDEIILPLNHALSVYVDSGLIWNIMTDTYHREIERYGKSSMELVEDLFFHDSVLTAGIVSKIIGDEGEIVRWGVGLRSIDEFINDFNYTVKEKLELLTVMKESFEKEHNINLSLKKQLSNKYRTHKVYIESILNRNNDDESDFKPIYDLIKIRSINNKPVINDILKLNKQNKLEKSLNEYMWSYLHMHNNRLFKSKQRTHELVMYFFLHQYYRSILAREKNVNKMAII